MAKNNCKVEYLSSSYYGDVSLCRDCRMVHLNLNNLTLRFAVEDFLGVSDLLAEAYNALHRKTEERLKEKIHLSLIKCH